MRIPKYIPWLFLSPFLVSLLVFFLFAAARVLVFSFTEYNLFDPPRFVGFQNFLSLFRDANFGYAVRNTLVYSVLVTIIQTILALGLAMVLNMRIRGIHFFRAGFYLPSVTSSVVVTVIFLWFFQRRGFFNFILSWLQQVLPWLGLFLVLTMTLQIVFYLREKNRGMPVKAMELPLLLMSGMISFLVVTLIRLSGLLEIPAAEPVDTIWLNTRETALGIPLPLWAIMFQNIFTTIPTLMLLFLAGLQNIPPQLYEAATIDGAGPLQRMTAVTLPGLRPVIFLILTLSLLGTLQMFDQVAVYGDAVPLQSVITLSYYVYNRMFPGGTLPQVGLASAAALFLALVTIAAVLLQRKLVKSEED